MDTNKSFRDFQETDNQIGHFCQFSQKETFFLQFRTTFFQFQVTAFEGVQYF